MLFRFLSLAPSDFVYTDTLSLSTLIRTRVNLSCLQTAEDKAEKMQ